jgi:glucoamylase
VFDREFPINRGRTATMAPALGRYSGDAYFDGNPWYIATLAGAEFEFRLAAVQTRAGSAAEADLARSRGDAYLETIRAFTPASGEMSEQFDKATGAQLSAKDLAWSYAAFITAAAARRAIGRL